MCLESPASKAASRVTGIGIPAKTDWLICWLTWLLDCSKRDTIMSVWVILCVDSKVGASTDSMSVTGIMDGNTLEIDVSVVTPEIILIGISSV